MKKVLQIIAALGFGFFALTTAVSAQEQSCQIQNTGQGSVNVCTNVRQRTCTINNTTNITVDNTNYQVSETGEATVVGNTNGGGAGSGSSSNTTSTTITFVVDNGDETEPEGPVQGLCTITTVTRTPVEETPAGGSGAAAAAVTTLPKTSGTSPVSIVALAAATVVAAVAALKGAVALKNRG